MQTGPCQQSKDVTMRHVRQWCRSTGAKSARATPSYLTERLHQYLGGVMDHHFNT